MLRPAIMVTQSAILHFKGALESEVHPSSPLLLICEAVQGGNDYEIFSSPKTIGHTVNSPVDTIGQCRELFIAPQQEALHGTKSS